VTASDVPCALEPTQADCAHGVPLRRFPDRLAHGARTGFPTPWRLQPSPWRTLPILPTPSKRHCVHQGTITPAKDGTINERDRTMNKIQALIGGIALVTAGAASAQSDWHIASPGMSSNTYGNTTYHSNGMNSRQYGNTTYHSNGTNSRQYGNTTYHSNGTSSRQYGNTTYHSNGTSSGQYGNTTYHSNGTTCRSYGNRTSC
jgi:hypothetical protein